MIAHLILNVLTYDYLCYKIITAQVSVYLTRKKAHLTRKKAHLTRKKAHLTRKKAHLTSANLLFISFLVVENILKYIKIDEKPHTHTFLLITNPTLSATRPPREGIK